MTTGHYQILYSVTEEDGRLIMEAPMETIIRYFHLHPDAIRRIDRETIRLEDRCVLSFGSKEKNGVRQVHVRRMPTVIPSPAEPTPEAPEDDPKTFLRENLP